MDDKLFLGTISHHRENDERKYPNGHRDIKRKLSFISKNIGDLQHQRKYMYKNSAKVKKIIHNQVNQVVKCLRARERSLWADVDEAYISIDESISEELSRLQSVHARCLSLFELFDDNRETADMLDKIYSTLSEVKFGEKQDVKALEFISDIETMKNMANYFGHLEGDFVKKDEFVFIDKKEDNLSDPVCQEFHAKKACSEKLLPSTTVETENSKNEYSNSTESEDSFEIVDLLESMSCEETVKDSVKVEQENSGRFCHQVGFVEPGYISKFLKVPNGLENSSKVQKSKDFNPEEEWKQIFEMRNKIANLNGISSKISEENKHCELQNSVSNYLNTDDCYDKNRKQNTYLAFKEADRWLHGRITRKEELSDKNCRQNKLLFLKEADSWLYNKSMERHPLKEERNLGRINMETNSDSSPAELIRQAFSSYLTKDSIQNWLLCNF